MKVPYKTLRFLGVRFYTDGKTVNEDGYIETSYRCGHGEFLKWYMVEAINLGLARIVINGKEIELRITEGGQRVYLQWVEGLAECTASTFEFGSFTPDEAGRNVAPATRRRRKRRIQS